MEQIYSSDWGSDYNLGQPLENVHGSQTSFREVQESVLDGKNVKTLPISIEYKSRTCAIVKIATCDFDWR